MTAASSRSTRGGASDASAHPVASHTSHRRGVGCVHSKRRTDGGASFAFSKARARAVAEAYCGGDGHADGDIGCSRRHRIHTRRSRHASHQSLSKTRSVSLHAVSCARA